ncbi:hypothetical protein FAI40_05180 [Acetobacteraceae bacterium]|nr:hypothetical protein FAI40_05180 [Acetobacteraceae bacterium]
MGEDFAANNTHRSSHAETEAPMAYRQLQANKAKKHRKEVLERALGLKKAPNPMVGITNLPGASYPSYGTLPITDPYFDAKLKVTPQPPLPPPYPGGPTGPGVYGNHGVVEPDVFP